MNYNLKNIKKALFFYNFINLKYLYFCVPVSFQIDMQSSFLPNENYNNIVVNGSWNNWQGWGLHFIG